MSRRLMYMRYRGAENIREWLFASEFTNEHRQEGVQIVYGHEHRSYTGRSTL